MSPLLIPVAVLAAIALWPRRKKVSAPPPIPERNPKTTIFQPVSVSDLNAAQFGSPAYMTPTETQILSLKKGDRIQTVLELFALPTTPAGDAVPMNKALLSEGTIQTVPGPGDPVMFNYIHDRIANLGDFKSDPFVRGEDISFIVLPKDVFLVL